DNIMTPFEYDVYPFTNKDPIDPSGNTLKVTGKPDRIWGVDGFIDDGSGAISQDDSKSFRRLVWGCEGQPLLLTETMAFHDRRVKDTKFDDGSGKMRDENNDNTPDDPTLDQVRIPQGSAFFELYCTANPNQPLQSADLFTAVGNQWYLNLGKLAPPSAAGV